MNSFNNETSSFNTDHSCLFDISGNKTKCQNSLSSIQSFVDVIGGPGKVDQIKKVFGFDAVKALGKLLDYESKTMVHSKILNAYMYFITNDFLVFWKMERNHSPNLHQKIWRINSLRTGALLGVISDIHRVYTNPEDPMDVRNDPPARQLSSSLLVFKLSDVSLGSDFIPFFKKVTCNYKGLLV